MILRAVAFSPLLQELTGAAVCHQEPHCFHRSCAASIGSRREPYCFCGKRARRLLSWPVLGCRGCGPVPLSLRGPLQLRHHRSDETSIPPQPLCACCPEALRCRGKASIPPGLSHCLLLAAAHPGLGDSS